MSSLQRERPSGSLRDDNFPNSGWLGNNVNASSNDERLACHVCRPSYSGANWVALEVGCVR